MYSPKTEEVAVVRLEGKVLRVVMVDCSHILERYTWGLVKHALSTSGSSIRNWIRSRSRSSSSSRSKSRSSSRSRSRIRSRIRSRSRSHPPVGLGVGGPGTYYLTCQTIWLGVMC